VLIEGELRVYESSPSENLEVQLVLGDAKAGQTH
jgi:hypothetical protein